MGNGASVSLKPARRLRDSSKYIALLLISTAMTGGMVGVADAQPTQAEPSASQSGRAQSYQFSIPAQPLAGAIATFTRITGLDIVGDGGIDNGTRSPGVSGTLTARQALTQLLAGTGLGYRFTNGSTVAIQRSNAEGALGQVPPGATQLETINVETAGSPRSTMSPIPAYAGGQVATGGQLGMLGNRDVMSTPFNQTSYTQKTIQDQQARTLGDVLENDPSIRAIQPRGYGFDTFYIRGFGVNNGDIGFNGLYGLSVPYSFSLLDSIERVDVLKGPSTLVNGMPPGGAVGGSINLVTKRAGDEPLAQLTTDFASNSQFGTHIDVGRRFGDNKEFGVRINGTYRDGGTEIDKQRQELGAISAGLDYRGERARWSADFGYQVNNIDLVSRESVLSTGVPVPKPPDASKGFMPPWTYSDNRTLFGMTQGEVDLTDNITAYGAVGASSSELTSLFVSPTIINSRGDFTARGSILNQNRSNVAGQVGLRAAADTGPIHHAINVNFSALQNYYENAPATNGPSFASNIYDPMFGLAPNLAIQDPKKQNVANLSGVGIADTFSALDERVQFTVGVRRQRVAVDSFNVTTGALTSSYDQSAWSPGYALVVKPLQNVSLYANYVEGLQQGIIVQPPRANAGQVFPPYQSKQMEAGVKVDWGTVTTTVSAFEIRQASAIVDVASNTQSVDGEQVNRGVELNAFGAITPDFRVLGGVMFIDGRQEKTANGTNDGKKAFGVPDVQVNLGAEWDTPFMQGFTVTGRVVYTGAAYVDAANTQEISDWTRLDLGARYTFTGPLAKPVTLRFNVLNVLDTNHWQTQNATGIFLGTPRTFLASATFNF